MWRQPDTEQERPYPAVHVGQSDAYKLMTKRCCAGRESEGLIVLSTLRDNRGRGKGPCFGRACAWR